MLQEKLHKIIPPQKGMAGDLYGLQFGSNISDRSIRKIVVCLDPTLNVIIQARKLNAHLIITHHGLTHTPKLNFNEDILKQIKLLSMGDIDLFVIHSALDAAKGGISETFAKMLNLEIIDNFYFDDHGKEKPIGRIGRPIQEKISLESFLKSVKRHLKLPSIQFTGDLASHVSKIAVIGGDGFNEHRILIAKKNGCDTLITGEVSYPEWRLARTLKINLIATSHYASENPGMRNLTRMLNLTFPRDEFIFVESLDPVLFHI